MALMFRVRGESNLSMKTLNIIVIYTNQSAYRIISVSILAQAFGLSETFEKSLLLSVLPTSFPPVTEVIGPVAL